MLKMAKHLSIEQYIDFKMSLYDRVIGDILNNMGLEHIRIKCVFRGDSQKYQASVKKAKSKKYDYIIFLFKFKHDDEWTIRLLALNTLKTIIHEVRHIYQIENNMFPEMLNHHIDIPYRERPWENDAYDYSHEYYADHRQFFRDNCMDIIRSTE